MACACQYARIRLMLRNSTRLRAAAVLLWKLSHPLECTLANSKLGSDCQNVAQPRGNLLGTLSVPPLDTLQDGRMSHCGHDMLIASTGFCGDHPR